MSTIFCDVCAAPATCSVRRDPFGKSDVFDNFCPKHGPKIGISAFNSLEPDFVRAVSIINDYYWAQSRKAGQKADDRAREFLTEMNAKHAVMLAKPTASDTSAVTEAKHGD